MGKKTKHISSQMYILNLPIGLASRVMYYEGISEPCKEDSSCFILKLFTYGLNEWVGYNWTH